MLTFDSFSGAYKQQSSLHKFIT